jgi:hypothetical protein
MKRRAAAIAALVSTGLVVLGPVAVATARHSHRPSHSLPPRTAAQPPARIACTPLSCQPIPAACTPVPGRTWGGWPTGYDVIVCPPRGQTLR